MTFYETMTVTLISAFPNHKGTEMACWSRGRLMQERQRYPRRSPSSSLHLTAVFNMLTI